LGVYWNQKKKTKWQSDQEVNIWTCTNYPTKHIIISTEIKFPAVHLKLIYAVILLRLAALDHISANLTPRE